MALRACRHVEVPARERRGGCGQRLPLPERVRLLLELRARFYAGEHEVPASQALS